MEKLTTILPSFWRTLVVATDKNLQGFDLDTLPNYPGKGGSDMSEDLEQMFHCSRESEPGTKSECEPGKYRYEHTEVQVKLAKSQNHTGRGV